MRRLIAIGVVLAIAAVVYVGLASIQRASRLAADDELHVLLAYHPALAEAHAGSLAAWRSVLAEEGIPTRDVDLFTLLDLPAAALRGRVPAVILPDGACRIMNSACESWLETYLQAGGAVLVVQDPGVYTLAGAWQPRSFCERFTGVRLVDPTAPQAAATTGSVRFRDGATAAACQIPPGKLDDEFQLCGYGYGRLVYPMASCAVLPTAAGEVDVLAEALVADGQVRPAATRRRHGDGTVYYTGLPLGWLASRGDGVLLRSLLRTWLIDDLRVPHLASTPRAIGGMIVNWHIDANDDWPVLARMVSDSLLREDLPASIHICAGEGLNAPGDGRGFDACGVGRPLVATLARYGEIGSHGGWYHNLYAAKVSSGEWGPAEIRDLVGRNSACLTQTTGRPVREYSAPAGVHPPDIMTPLLNDMGVIATYWTGDSGGAPGRGFWDGRQLDPRLIHVPVMSLGSVASIGEMRERQGLAASDVSRWLDATADYCERNRTVRMIYSHPYDLYGQEQASGYRAAFRAWLDDLAARQAAGRLQVRPMAEFASFLRRILDTTATFRLGPAGMAVTLSNPAGLRDVAVRVPREGIARPAGLRGVSVTEVGPWYVFVVEDDRRAVDLRLPRI